MKKIAFCFLIYDCINCEELWNIFFKNVDPNKYTIYIHYKTNKPLKYFEKYKLDNCIETKYADVSLVKCQNVLLKEALKDINNEHFIFISNSCVPFKNFDYIYKKLDKNFSYFNTCEQTQCFPRCDNLLKFVEQKNIQKASQWCILNRKHSNIMITNTNLIKLCKNIYAPDEICYITNIFINNFENEIITTLNLANGATTFTNWFGMDYKFPSQHGLKNYSTISKEEIDYLLNSECLFGRKFNRECITCFINKEYINFISSSSNK